MKYLLKLEELAQFLLCTAILVLYDVPWWTYLLLLLGPDIGMLGYLVNTRVGALTYNLLHHKGLAVVVFGFGMFLGEQLYLSLPAMLDHTYWTITGLVLFGHASMDRIFGYGLKFGDHFQHTHMGWIGKGKHMST